MNLLRVFLLSLLAAFWGVAAGAGEEDLTDVRGLMDAGQLKQAIERVDQFLGNHPGDADARFLKALILVRQNQSDAAITLFTGLTKDYPNLPEPYNNLAVLYAARGDYEKAREALLEAIRTHPSYATAHENLGDLYAKMAAVAYDRALALDQQNQAAQSKLAMINELFSEHGGHPMIVPAQTEASSATVDKEETSQEQAAVAPAPEEMTPWGPQLEHEVLATVLDWVAAWSAQDVNAYLRYYGADFRPPDGMGRPQWEAQRRARLTRPSYIEVTVSDPGVRVEPDGRARVSFVQTYRSNTYSDRTTKTLLMSREDSGWKIVSEQAVP
jgi:tetratricopeptide (TPR) repeat protein